MKRIHYIECIISCLILAVAFTSFSRPSSVIDTTEQENVQEESSEVVELIGTVSYFGNAPFEFPGFVCEDGKKYGIQISEDATCTLDDLKSHNGDRIKVTGTLTEEGPVLEKLDGGFIVVRSFSIYSEK